MATKTEMHPQPIADQFEALSVADSGSEESESEAESSSDKSSVDDDDDDRSSGGWTYDSDAVITDESITDVEEDPETEIPDSGVTGLASEISAETYKLREGVEIIDQCTFHSDSDPDDFNQDEYFTAEIGDNQGFGEDYPFLKDNLRINKKVAKFAITQYNENNLRIVKLLKVNESTRSEVESTYITLTAKEMDDEDGSTTKTYQAKVEVERFPRKKKKLAIFKLSRKCT